MTEELPTREECIGMLKEAGCSENVIIHCLAVEELASKIANMTNADKRLVEVAALLHDIGRAKTHGIDHAEEGARMAEGLGLPESIVLIIERHIGAGITKVEAKELGLPEKDYIPITIEEKIIAHADNLIDENEKQKVEKVVRKFEKLDFQEAAEKVLALHKELSEICGVDLDYI